MACGSRDIAEIYERHVDTVYRVCYTYLKNAADTEDAVSDTFYNMIKSDKAFESEIHEKAWLIRTAINVCKNVLKHWRRKAEPIEEHEHIAFEQPDPLINDMIDAVKDLPDKYKSIVCLYYYDGYNCAEIAEILHKKHSTVRGLLHEARNVLKLKLGGE